MFEIPECESIQDNEYKIKCIIKVGDKEKEVIFSRNDYDVLFISYGDKGVLNDYIRAICISTFLKNERPDIVEDLKRVHPAIPIFYINDLDLSSFTYGFILGVLNVDNS